MCGRYVVLEKAGQLKLQFGVAKVVAEVRESYNVAPTQEVPVIVTEGGDETDGERVLDAFRWGLIPSWAKDTAIGAKLINARAETVAEKPAFRNALRRRRCVVPATGFYEWDKVGSIGALKQPYYFARTDGKMMGFAGLWETWRSGPEEPWLHSCTIITTEANEIVGRIHDRMPVILPDDDMLGLWLDSLITDADVLRTVLVPYPDDRLSSVAVSTRVNRVVNDDTGLIEPVENSA